MYTQSRRGISVLALLLALSFPFTLKPQSSRPRALVTQPVRESVLHRLAGNTRSQANARNDAGRVPDDLSMAHLLLQLQRPAEREAALDQLLESQQDPASPNYHRWLSVEEVGASFGPAQEDIQAVTGWLESHGFQVNSVYPNGMLIDFSGTAGQVRAAFRTEIHHLNVNGAAHLANMSDPMIPEALAPVVAGVVSMHDFMPRTLNKRHAAYTFTSNGATEQAVTPADLATIYDMNPLFNAKTPITGKGQTIAVVEDSDLYSTSDWTTFRSTFGLASYGGTLATVHPSGSGANNCLDPGVNSDDVETTLDAEWASAAAPGAAIQVAACANTRTTFGGLIAINNLLSSSAPPSIISLSYGECEAENGATANLAYYNAFKQAAAMGVSVFVSAGDEGAASCDAGATGATHGIGVSAFASTPYNVAVGGTDFGDTAAGTNSSYWNSSNTATYGSAKSYVPEIPWNDSCAGSVITRFFSYSQAYGSSGFCSSTTATQGGLQEVVAGSGGPSGCATGSPSVTGVVGGTCKGWPKPSWQSLTGVPADGVRDIPDVSLFAADGLWGHYYVMCYSDRHNGGARCTGAPSTWGGAGGTSFSAPIMAGIQALINQTNGKQGNPAPKYYQLAAQPGGQIFHSITQGDIAVNCSGSVNCFGASAPTGGTGRRSFNNPTANGVLSTSTTSLAPAYNAAAGWNFATGIGSVDVYNLVKAWQ